VLPIRDPTIKAVCATAPTAFSLDPALSAAYIPITLAVGHLAFHGSTMIGGCEPMAPRRCWAHVDPAWTGTRLDDIGICRIGRRIDYVE
jgi:hypothetical protein